MAQKAFILLKAIIILHNTTPRETKLAIIAVKRICIYTEKSIHREINSLSESTRHHRNIEEVASQEIKWETLRVSLPKVPRCLNHSMMKQSQVRLEGYPSVESKIAQKPATPCLNGILRPIKRLKHHDAPFWRSNTGLEDQSAPSEWSWLMEHFHQSLADSILLIGKSAWLKTMWSSISRCEGTTTSCSRSSYTTRTTIH